MITQIQRSVLLPYPVSQVFELVADVGEYCNFVPYCKSSRIVAKTGNDLTASLEIQYTGIHQEIVTKNRCDPYSSIQIHLVEGPFNSFQGEWTFNDFVEGCRTNLSLEFELKGRFVQTLSELKSTGIVNEVLDAFALRARTQAIK